MWAGCGPPSSRFCRGAERCLEQEPGEFEECVRDLDDAAQTAFDLGCKETWAEQMACAAKNAECLDTSPANFPVYEVPDSEVCDQADAEWLACLTQFFI